MVDIKNNEELETDLAPPTIIWYKSKGFLAGIATMAQGLIMVVYGVELSAEETQALTNALLGTGVVITGALSVYGRLKGKKRIVLRKEKK